MTHRAAPRRHKITYNILERRDRIVRRTASGACGGRGARLQPGGL